MNDYKRFVSYLFDYKNNQKGLNCGYLKTEYKKGTYKLDIRIQDTSLICGDFIEIFIFTRKTTVLEGTLLGTLTSQTHEVIGHLEGISSSFLLANGIIIRCNQRFSYASSWDDLPIIPEHFLLDDTEETPRDMAPLTVEEINLSAHDFFVDHEAYQPFEDSFLSKCTKLDLTDFPTLHKHRLLIGNNPFTMHAYTEHRHFILGILSDTSDNHYLFGVPGTYHPKEKFMAQLYGFPYFKHCHFRQASDTYNGYWYRLFRQS